MPTISAVILAAGRSTRFPGNKLLTRIGGKTIIERVLGTFQESRVDRIIVVVGWQARKLLKSIEGLNVEAVINEKYDEGMSSSVRLGVRKVLESDAVIIHPADVPFISTNTINKVIESYNTGGKPIVVAGYKGRPGHPILFCDSLFPEILEIREETLGLKSVVSRHSDEILVVETEPACLFDIDSPEDLKRIAKIVDS